MMLTLKRAGKLKSLAGLIVGGMTDMKDNTVPFGKSAEEITRSQQLHRPHGGAQKEPRKRLGQGRRQGAR